MTYGPTTYEGNDAFCVNWVNVGEYSHGAVPNDIQLLLVDRSDTDDTADPTFGDFDIVFNYDRIQWDHGDPGDDDAARAGYSNGLVDEGRALELTGSGETGAFFDSNETTGLIHNYTGQSPTDPQLGRYVFPVRNGAAPPPGAIAGRVYRNGDLEDGVEGAIVSACRASGGCRSGATNSDGQFTLNGLPADSYTLRVNPPSGSPLFPVGGIGPVVVESDPRPVVPAPIELTGPAGLPADMTIGGAIGGDDTGEVPTVVVGRTIDLVRSGCEGGAGIVRVLQNGAQRDLLYRNSADGAPEVFIQVGEAPMLQAPAGTYTTHIRLPFTGSAEIQVNIDGCEDRLFNIYIDPSGFVREVDGTAIVGAQVVLYALDEVSGRFEVVPDGSAVMSPSNRRNPDVTDGTGHFGWDVIPGQYFVRATAPGCDAPGASTDHHVDTIIYTIPPPVFDIDLRLQCGEEAPPPDVVWDGTMPTPTTTAPSRGSTSGGTSTGGPARGPAAVDGYCLLAADGTISCLGDAAAGVGERATGWLVDMAATPSGGGHWVVNTDGGVVTFGDAPFFGSLGGVPLNKPIVGIVPTTTGRGYWLVAADGGVFAFGDAAFLGSTAGIPLAKPIVGMAADPDGLGYWLVASDGGVFAFGAPFSGSTGGIPLAKPIVGMAADPDGLGYWLVASDGGVFALASRFAGSTGGIPLVRPIVDLIVDPSRAGYWLVASDGGVFAFGVPFFGSLAGSGRDVVAGSPSAG